MKTFIPANCYKVTLKVTTSAGNTARVDDSTNEFNYITVENGVTYIMASHMQEAASLFPNAINIELIGPSYIVKGL